MEELMSRILVLARTACALATVLFGAGHPAAAQEAPRWYLGEIRWVPYSFAPVGWASCDGQLLLITENEGLFALIGTRYGGNGQTTFALPDLRGRMPLHVGMGPGLTNRSLGEAGGAEAHALTAAQLPAHDHVLGSHTHGIPALAIDLKASSGAASSTSAAGNVLGTATAVGSQKATTRIYAGGPANVSLGASGTTAPGTTQAASGTTGMTGEVVPHPAMPPFLGVRCIIATTGLFPQQQ
jgi:microcystin-dependent protein